MDSGGAESRPLSKAEKKRQRDKERKRPGKLQKKRLQVLQNPTKIAFRGWETEPQPWSLATSEDYIEWCHISKLFPLKRHQVHRHSNKANLKHCLNKDFANRCIQVFQFMYRMEIMRRCEAPLFICRMVYAEVVLHKVVDWTTVRSTPSMVHFPTEMDIPRDVSLFPSGILERAKKVEVEDQDIVTESSEPDSDSDGKRVHRVSRTPIALASRKRRHVERVIAAASSSRGQDVRGSSVANNGGGTDNVGRGLHNDGDVTATGSASNVIAGRIDDNGRCTSEVPNAVAQEVDGNAHEVDGGAQVVDGGAQVVAVRAQVVDGGAQVVDGGVQVVAGRTQVVDGGAHTEANQLEACVAQDVELQECKAQLRAKDLYILQLKGDIDRLLSETKRKSTMIANLKEELDHHATRNRTEVRAHVEPTTTGMEIDDDAIADVVNRATYGVIEDSPQLVRNRRQPVYLPPLGPLSQPFVDSQGTEDSLSFPPPQPTVEVRELREANAILRSRVRELSETYYQWKVACIMSVDRARQMALEYKKIDNDYLVNNARRDFGLTSWADIDELFPSDMPMKEGPAKCIDWAKLDWDYENAMSCHDLRGVEGSEKSHKLWPNPATFTLDGTLCAICQNGFGPEGGWALGSCKCMFHPMCLIGGFLTRRFCPLCKSPFHARLYEMFGLVAYMAPGWEKNPDNTPGDAYRNTWGDDLIWSWRAQTHETYKANVSSQLGWEQDHEEIVRVCKKIIGEDPRDDGKRNFFYQTLNGYWDSKRNQFQFGDHPKGLIWNKAGTLVTNQDGLTPIDLRDAVAWDISEWKEVWKKDAVDYLLETHSPETVRALRQLRNSNMLQTLIQTDGPHRRTRARRKLISTDGAGSSRAGTSGTTGDPLED